MSEFKHITADDLALFALQFLSPEETSVVDQHVKTCPECRRELASIQGDLAAFAHTAEMHTPPALARQRLMKQVGREKKIVPVAPPAEPVFRPDATQVAAPPAPVPFSNYAKSIDDDEEDDRPTKTSVAALIFGWSGWAVAAGLAVGGFYIYREREDLQQNLKLNAAQMASLSEDANKAREILDALSDSSTQRVTLTRAENAPAPTGRVIYRADKGMLLFLASNIEPAAPGKAYELWIIPSEAGRAPVPAGVFRPDTRGNASIIMPELPKGVTAKAFGVTVEDQGGSQVPTLPIIMVGM